MFVKITKSGPRRYVQLVEAYRDEAGRPKQRTIVTLGRLDQSQASLKSVHTGLSRLLNRDGTGGNGIGDPVFESSRAVGDLWALTVIWKQLGLDRLRVRLRQRSRHRIDLEALLRVMVMNRLCDAESKPGTLRWLKTVSLPDVELDGVNHQQLLRTMDALIEHQDVIDEVVTDAVRPLISDELSVVFYDMTTIRAEGLCEQAEELRRFGMSKEGGIARQFMLGLVQSAEGIPLYHEVFAGNTAEVSTLKASLLKVLERYPVKRVIAVADRGLLSLDNLEELQRIVLPSGEPLEFILAVPGRRYNEFAQLLAPFEQRVRDADMLTETVGEVQWNGLRLVVAHDPQRAAEQGAQRDATIARVEAQAAQWVGKLLLVTNTTDLSATEIIARYKSLADIERGFKMLKSDIGIGPVYHRLPDRIRAHAYICFIALVLARVMRARLYENPVPEVGSPERALSILRRIQTHKVSFDGRRPVIGLSTIDDEQAAVLTSLKIKKPTAGLAYVNL